MNEIMAMVGLCTAFYILGSFPTATFLMFVLTGQDIKKYYHGALTYQNLWHDVGFKVVLLVLIAEFIKGLILAQTLKIFGIDVCRESLFLFGLLGVLFPWNRQYRGLSALPVLFGGFYLMQPATAQVMATIAFVVFLVTRSEHQVCKSIVMSLAVSGLMFKLDWTIMFWTLAICTVLMVDYLQKTRWNWEKKVNPDSHQSYIVKIT